MVSVKGLGLLKQVLATVLVSLVASCGSGGSSSSSSGSSSSNSLSTEPAESAPISTSPETSSPEQETEDTASIDTTDTTPTDPVLPTDPVTAPTGIERNSVKQFTFNHSLWQHTSSQHTNMVTGFWVGEFARESGTTYSWGGQFGQLRYHELPPRAWLGSDNSADLSPLGENAIIRDIDLDNVLIMPPNFVQGGDATARSRSLAEQLALAQRVIDWIIDESSAGGQKSDLPIYIYEHWPEAISDNLSESQFQAYHQVTTGSYHQWFLGYQNGLLALYPDVDFRTIPVGPIIADILQNDALAASQLSFTDLYEDESPHGKPNIYFLAGLVTYQAMYGQQVNANYRPPVDPFGGVSSELAGDENFNALNDFVWERLSHYNANGVRVWP